MKRLLQQKTAGEKCAPLVHCSYVMATPRLPFQWANDIPDGFENGNVVAHILVQLLAFGASEQEDSDQGVQPSLEHDSKAKCALCMTSGENSSPKKLQPRAKRVRFKSRRSSPKYHWVRRAGHPRLIRCPLPCISSAQMLR